MKVKGINSAITIKDPKDLKRIANRLKEVNYKAYILWSIAINTGYRGGDLVKLTVKDIKEAIKYKKLIILEEKTVNTRKVQFKRVVVISNSLLDILSDFVKDKSDSEYLYPSQKGRGRDSYKTNITRGSLGKIFRKVIVDDLGIAINSVGTHTPRKTYGYFQYLESGKDINYVQELFGHSSPKVTKAYIGIDDDILNESAKTMDKYVF